MPVLHPLCPPIARSTTRRRAVGAILSAAILLLSIAPTLAVSLPGHPFDVESIGVPDHLVVSEVMSGGTSASDEFIELYNPTSGPLPLEGLELVYVTASGATITRKATWPLATPEMEPGSHLLIANEAGIFASIADVTYATGLAAAGGSVALRIIGASDAIDAVGWGTAVGTWLETRPAPAPAAGASLERLLGGAQGSGQDTNDNLIDFAIVELPDPQNSASPPILSGTPPSPPPSASATTTATPSFTPTPSPLGTPTTSPTPSSSPMPTSTVTATPTSSPMPTPTSTPTPITIAEARAAGDGAFVTVAAVALTDSAFADGGGYVADVTAGIAVLLSDGSYNRGDAVLVSGVVDDRYGQRTLRSESSSVVTLGPATEPTPQSVVTGAVGETVEGRLITLEGIIVSGATTLSSGVAFDVDDGSGPIRVMLNSNAGIDEALWQRDGRVSLVGVVGQRDSSGTGTSGYRVQPRDSADILLLAPPPTPSPSPTPTATPSSQPTQTATPSASPSVSPSPTPSEESAPLVSIAAARASAKNRTLRIRGVVTAGNGLIDASSAIVQDSSGAILIRTSGEGLRLQRGQLVELLGTTSTKSGMVSVRVNVAPVVLGTAAEPPAVRSATGRLGEPLEAQLIVTRGALTANPRRSSAGTISFTVNDGSGEIRVYLAPEARIDATRLGAGTWIEVRGVLVQETTTSEPARGYQIWPRDGDDLTLIAPGTASGAITAGAGGHGSSGSGGSSPGHAAPVGVEGKPGVLGVEAGGAPPQAPRLGTVAQAGVHAAQVLDPVQAEVESTQRPQRTPLQALGILALSAAALAAFGLVGWRSGAITRLITLIAPRQGSASVNTPAPDANSEADPEQLVRLTVVPGSAERVGS